MDWSGLRPEVSEIKNMQPEITEFQEIKPQEGMTFQEAQDFWKDMFSSEIKPDEIHTSEKGISDSDVGAGKQEVSEDKRYYDDNGHLYRVGNELEPNCQYEVNGYRYETDENGRIISAEGSLHLKDREGRLPIRDSIEDIGKGDQREGDDRGHLIGDQFDGSNGLENMVPQDAEINRNDYKNMENELAGEVRDGKEVQYMVEPVYDEGSRRPSAIVVTYSVDGENNVRVFPNGKEE
ncbi:MAG: hypothetical protein HFH88_10775 [Lachnospiraceae bacterium]|nr:hypothetical protein [Lachnospiraceae bacterium]